MSSKVNEFQILNADGSELMRIGQDGTLSLNKKLEKTSEKPYNIKKEHQHGPGAKKMPLC